MRAVTRSLAAGLPLLLSLARPALAQQAVQGGPLRKSDLIRMLVTGVPPKEAVASRIRLYCLSFSPSERDRTDIRLAGADSAVMAAIAGCGRSGGGASQRGGAPPSSEPPTGAPPPAAGLWIRAPVSLRAFTGTQITVTATAFRGTVPQGDVSLEVRGARAIPGGMGMNPEGITNSRGTATFRIATGSRPGNYRLEVALRGSAPGTEPMAPIVLMTVPRTTPSPQPRVPTPGVAGPSPQPPTPSPALQAQVRPAEILVRTGTDLPIPVLVVVKDAAGRPAAGVWLELGAVSAELAMALAPASTDLSGVAAFSIPPAALRRGGSLGVFASGTRIGVITVRLQTITISDERTRFVMGADQRGAVHTALRQRLALEVRDSAGRPVRDYPVTFTVKNGHVDPATAVTDTGGVARVAVTLGDQAGPVVVAASAGRVTRQALLYATPGSAAQLIVERNGVPLEGALSLTSRDPVTLVVGVRDAYGNGTLLTGLSVTATGSAVSVGSMRGALAPGEVVIEPRRSGAGQLAIHASGLDARVQVQVRLPRPANPWLIGARAGGVGFSYHFPSTTPINGNLGYRGDLLVGRSFGGRWSIEAGGGLGLLHADTGGVQVSVKLSQGYLRGEYTPFPDARVIPVISLGAGSYHMKSDDPGAPVVSHTSLFFLAAVGADFPLAPRVVGQVRLEGQRLYEANSQYQNGFVGALTVFEAGIRILP